MAISKSHKDIKQDLIDQLERSGVVGKHTYDLVNDYMSLWETKEMLRKDVKERGVVTQYNNGGGQSGYKKNDSVDMLLKVNMQMLKLLHALGVDPSQAGDDADDDM